MNKLFIKFLCNVLLGIILTGGTITAQDRILIRGRVIDKVQRLAYDVYLDFVNDDYSVTPEGNPTAGALKTMQGNIEDVVNRVMTSANEISGFRAYVNPVQDVVGTGEIKVELDVQPRAYYKNIKVVLGFVKAFE